MGRVMSDVTHLDPKKRLMLELIEDFKSEIEDLDGMIIVGLNKGLTPCIRIIGNSKQLAEAATFINYQVYSCISDSADDE